MCFFFSNVSGGLVRNVSRHGASIKTICTFQCISSYCQAARRHLSLRVPNYLAMAEPADEVVEENESSPLSPVVSSRKAPVHWLRWASVGVFIFAILALAGAAWAYASGSSIMAPFERQLTSKVNCGKVTCGRFAQHKTYGTCDGPASSDDCQESDGYNGMSSRPRHATMTVSSGPSGTGLTWVTLGMLVHCIAENSQSSFQDSCCEAIRCDHIKDWSCSNEVGSGFFKRQVPEILKGLHRHSLQCKGALVVIWCVFWTHVLKL